MQDFPADHVHALAAHVEGLEAALAALPADASAGASLRRIARSLASAADALGAAELAEAAHKIKDAGDASLEAAARDFLRLARAAVEPGSGDPIEVLLVEDNRTVALAMRGYLRGPGYVVHHAGTAADAERVLREHAIDLVLLDLILPDRDGRDLLVQMREDPATAGVPVIVLSAKEGAVPKAECLAVGAREFIEKPVEPAALRAAVARHARRRSAPEAEARPEALPSRADLVEAYEPMRKDAARGTPAAVALLAVHDFPLLMEALGEDAADDLLASIGRQLTEGLGGRQILGRWGRGQLVTLLPRSSAAEARRLLKSAFASLAASDVLARIPGDVTPTFGAGVALGAPGQDLREVVSAAEQSLLRARSRGRRVVVTEEDVEPERPPRVLLVEDDRVTATLVHHRLEREGFEVMDFLNGEDAFQWATETDFELAILDVKVPGMDGFELLERLRAIPRLESVPVVMLTGLGGEADVVRGLELGANDYMLKPFSPTELLARVRRLAYWGPGAADEAGRPPAELGAP